MGFSIFCIVEACILIANAVAILNDRFLKQGKSEAIRDSSHQLTLTSRLPRGRRELQAASVVRSGHELGTVESSRCSERQESDDHILIHVQEVYEMATYSGQCFIYRVRAAGRLKTRSCFPIIHSLNTLCFHICTTLIKINY